WGGPADYWSLILDVRKFLPLADKHTVALFSLSTLQTGQAGIDVSIHQDFHIGGTNTIRGWSLDSRNGKHQFINTVEYRFNVLQPRTFSIKGFTAHAGIQLAVFGDYGLAWNDRSEFTAGNFIGSYGVGVRALVPYVDMLRFDFAYGESGEGVQFHFGIDEKAFMQRRRIR
ncbi:BamA/TamA family outer membrane protein, partial [Acidobacteriota bacterium]